MFTWFGCSAACIVAVVSPRPPHAKLVRTTFAPMSDLDELADACDAEGSC